MTKSTITRERLEELAAGQSGFNLRIATLEESQELARMALAAMGSEPYGFTDGDRRGMIYKPEHADRLNEPVPVYRHAQPAPVVPEDVRQALSQMDDEIIAELDAEESACRAATLQAGNSPAQSDCCQAQNHASPEQNGDTPAQSQGWIPVSERMPESNGVYFGWDGKRVLEVNCFFGGFSANQFIHGEITHWMPLPAPPTEVK
ncbi:DUF551 domain-containing protein [Klebsiella pneumoniae]|uniref:DUF551 domain-containing protein n=1 Tax=Klebsiella pneumoniae TaxID=573 RepID=UPI00296DCB40|nr:DUF551 domain-containing protein [Klebsiella pneumoniae]HEF8915075.1 DUF551 domain-containing protein [Klebsiella pneumoniae]HEF8941556.1 DUF551 domain-containing protein [Klebsiella pneumoniae]HEG3573718.1 DUF551 domain-containing protein [Klebsiella pneumoniae]HEG4253042.1 DUF551 domain-containing protein [Klebsiella pneumoniae]